MERTIKEKEINLAGKKIMVRELSVADVKRLVIGMNTDSDLFDEMLAILEKTTGLTADDLDPFTFSELERLFDTIVEVNGSFFNLARKLGVSGLGEKIREILIASFTVSFSALLNEDMPTFGNMDGPNSSTL